jgi:putative addiction module component (TIGR02574 family)
MRLSDIPGIENLSSSEKIMLVEAIWDGIASDESSVPVPQSHLDELERRLMRYQANSGKLLSAEKLWRRIEARKIVLVPRRETTDG